MPRHLANIRPSFIVRVGGEVRDGQVDDVAIEGIFMEVPVSHEVFNAVYTTVDLLDGVDTYDGNVIRLLENIQAAMSMEPVTSLLVKEVSDGPTS